MAFIRTHESTVRPAVDASPTPLSNKLSTEISLGDRSTGWQLVPADAIIFPAVKIRVELDEEYLQELAESVKKEGIIEPIIVRPKGKNFEVVAGEQRVRAARAAGLAAIPVIVRQLGDREAYEQGLTENLQRKDLSAYEVARAFRVMMKTWPDIYPTQSVLASKLGKSETWISKHMAILDVEQDLVKAGIAAPQLQTITSEQAREIRAAPPYKRAEIIKGIIETGVVPSTRNIEGTVSPNSSDESEDTSKPASKPTPSAHALNGGKRQEEPMNNMFQLMTSLDKRLDAMEQKIAVQAPAQPVTAAPQPAPAMTQPPIQAQPQPIQAQPQMPPGLGIVMQGQPIDLFTVMRFIQGLPPDQKRMYFGPQAAEKPGDQQLQVFQQLDSDHAWVDIMESLNIGFEDMQRYVEKYNTMKKLSAEKENLGSPYLAAWYDACKVIGENVRRGCSHFNEPDGTCQRWALEDIPKQYRDTYRGMYRSMRNKEGYLFNVERNAEICAVCQRAKIVEGED